MRNKKISFLTIFFLIASFSHAQISWDNTSFVHRSNKQIVDGQNNPIQLNGVNLGGWLMWEGWIWGGGYTQQKTIYNNIQSKVGAPAATAFRDSVYKYFITKKDIQKISEECFNVVRIPFNSSMLEDDFTPYTYKPEGWALLDSVLSWCEAYNVYAILDMHSAPGGQSWSFTADPDFIINLWNGTVNQNRTRRMWKAIANRYKNRGIIAAYDLLNEPDNSSDSAVAAFQHQLIDSIRTVDNNHMIFLEGNTYATDFSMFTSLYDNNTAYQFHFYTWFLSGSLGTHVQAYTDLSTALNAPIWCGEWGENNYTQLTNTLNVLNDPMYGVSGTAFWTWKKMKAGSTYPYYNGIDTTSAWMKTIRWISNNSMPEPTPAEAQTGLDEFIQKMKIDNCTFNPTLSAILENCTGTGIAENNNNIALKVYPQPAINNVTVEFGRELAEANMFLRNISGQIVLSWSTTSADRTNVDMTKMPAGIYILNIQSAGQNFSVKIIKD